MGLKFTSDSLTIMLSSNDKNMGMMVEFIKKFNYSFDDDGMFHIISENKTVCSARYEITEDKLKLVIEKPRTYTLEFLLYKD